MKSNKSKMISRRKFFNKLTKKNINSKLQKTKKNLVKSSKNIYKNIYKLFKKNKLHKDRKGKKYNVTKLNSNVTSIKSNMNKKHKKHKKRNTHKKHKNNTYKLSKVNNTNLKLNGGSCDEYAYVNEPEFRIPDLDGIKGLFIPSTKASIGKVVSCPKVDHA